MIAWSEVCTARIANHLHTRLDIAQAIDPMTARHARNTVKKLHACDADFAEPVRTFNSLRFKNTVFFKAKHDRDESSHDASDSFGHTLALQISEDRSHVIQTLHCNVLRAWTVIKDLH